MSRSVKKGPYVEDKLFERVKAQIKELPNCAALQDKLCKQNKKIKNSK